MISPKNNGEQEICLSHKECKSTCMQSKDCIHMYAINVALFFLPCNFQNTTTRGVRIAVHITFHRRGILHTDHHLREVTGNIDMKGVGNGGGTPHYTHLFDMKDVQKKVVKK